MRVGCADQNILRGDFLDGGAHLVSERRGKPKEISANYGDKGFVLLEDKRAHVQLALFASHLMGGAHSPADRQQRVGRDNAYGNAGTKFCRGAKSEVGERKQKDD